MRCVDLTGRKFGMLTVTGQAEKPRRWNCTCDCGSTSVPTAQNLLSGHTTSCGCRRQRRDLTGLRFGKLVVVGIFTQDSHRNQRWHCRCDCGGSSTPIGAALLGGKTASCGCESGGVKLDLSGRRFGRLLVKCRLPGQRGRVGAHQWECLCDCGETTFPVTANLTKGTTQSCGCLAKDLTAERSRVYPNAERSSQAAKFRGYIGSAKNRGHVWELSFDDFISITTQNCIYCGQPPQLRPKTWKKGIDIFSSGIDRVDSSKGYTHDNVVPCCSWCNTAKLNHDMVHFVEKCRAVAAKFANMPEVS